MSFWTAVATFFKDAKIAWDAANTLQKISYVFTAVTAVVGVKGFLQARNMQNKGQDILANKTAAGGKLPVIYGTRRVGAQIIYMDVSANDSRDLYVVYALSVGECDEIIGRTIELDGNPLTDSARFRDGGYIGSDKISSGSGSLNTVSQNGTGIDAGAGQFGTSPTQKYRYVMNLHHGAATQTADPMLVASMPNWTTAHKLNGVAYIAAHYGYDKEGMWSGVPQLTVQVRGKKVFDPRDTNQTFGTVSTYEYSDNPALTFLDYITNNEYGKGLTQSQINMSTFTAAANVCDTEVDQPYFNGSAQPLTWSGNAGDNFITIGGTSATTTWWQNKVGELIDIYDTNGNGVIDGKEITEIRRDNFYDENEELIVYINDTLGSTYSSQTGSSLVKVKRFHCNGYLDGNKNVMDNAKELLANMRGIFLYIDGKYELSIEDTGSATFNITDDHIISDAGISVDYGNKDKKANKVIVEFFNANKKYELDTATVLHDASPEYYSDDGDEILEIKAEFPYVTDPYIAYNMAKAILVRSRKQMTIQFLGTPEMYKLNVGDIVTLSYAGTFDTTQTCRVEALELQSNGLVSVSLIEYFDVYTWETPPEEPLEELANLPSAYAVKAPTGLSFTDTDSSSTGRPFLSWNEPTDFPDYQYRVNVVDSSSNQVLNRIVDVENCDLNFIPKSNNYVASVTSLNTLGTESSAANLTFSVADEPTVAADIKDGSITTVKIADDAVSTAKIIDDAVTNALIATDAVNQDSIAANSVTALEIVADTITASEIAASTITAAEIASNTITATQMAADSITATEIDVTNLSAISADLGSITAGDMNIGSGNFTVSSSGFMSATGATISGNITATSLNVTNATVTGTLDASVIRLNNEPLDDVLTYSEVGGIGLLTLNEGAAIDGDFVVAGNFEATGSQPDLIVGKVTGIASDTVQADAILRSSTGSGGFRIQAGSGNTQVVGLVYDAVGGTTLSADGGASGTFKINADGALAVTFDSSQNATFTGEVTADALGLPSNTPSTTTNKLYNVGGSLYFNGSAVGGGGASTTINNNADNRIITGSGTANTLNAESGLTYNGSALSVSGTISSGAITAPSISNSGTVTVNNTGTGVTLTVNRVSGNPNIKAGTDDSGYLIMDSSGASAALNWYTSNNVVLAFGGGNVGIADNTPSQRLDVNGNIGISGTEIITSSRNLINIGTISQTGAISLNSNSLSDPDSTSRTRYPAGQMLTHYSEANGVSIIGGQGGYTGCGLTIGEETGRSANFKLIRGISDTNGSTAEEFSIDGVGNAVFAGTISSGAITASSSINLTAGQYKLRNTVALDHDGNSLYIKAPNLVYFEIGNTNVGNLNGAGRLNLKSYQVNGTTVIDTSRNLTNIGTISSGAIVSTGTSQFDRVKTGLGTVGSPAVQVGDTDSGFYDSGANEIGVSLAGVLEYEFIATQFDMKSNNLTGVGTISSGAITANGGGSQHEFISSSDAPLVVRSTDASSGIAFTDNSGTNYIFYRGSLNHFYTNSGTLGVGLTSVGSGQALNVAGGIGISGTTVIDANRNLTNIRSITNSGDIVMTDATPFLVIQNTTENGGGIVFNDLQAGAWPAASSQQFRMTYHSGNNSFVMGHDENSYTGFSFASGGNFTANGNVTAYSDERLKTNIQTLDSKKALQMRGVSFVKDGVKGSGVIAQEIEEIAPELVITADDEMGTKSVAYGNLVGYLIETVKDQQKQIDELKQRLDNDSSN
jgi:hypothetical protein